MNMVRTLILVLLALPGSLLAQADPAQERAKALFLQGRAHLDALRYGRALDAFEQANAIKPHPVMLKNIARTYEAMDDLERALAYDQQYLDSKPKDAAEVAAGMEKLKARLAEWPRISLTTDPPGAAVWVGSIDNRARGVTPLQVPVPPGARKLFLSLAGYEAVEREVRVSPKQNLTLPVITFKKQQPSVAVRTEPAGAEVSLDGTPVGRTPWLGSAPAGAHTLRVVLEGFDVVEQAVELAPSHTREAPLTLDLVLQKARPIGELRVQVDDGAELILDGKSLGRAPMAAPVSVEAGLHTLEVRPAGGGDVYREMVTIEAGRLTETSIHLEKGALPAIDQRTVSYVVMGVGGAAMLGGVVTSILALGADGDLQDCRADAACQHTDRELALADDVRSQALTTDLLVGIGAAVAATGVVLFVLDGGTETKGEARVSRLGLLPAPGGGAVAVGAFEF